VNFKEDAKPDYGRYVKEPARANKNGVQYIPKRENNPYVLAGVAVFGAVAILGAFYNFRSNKQSS
jgi:hypothetical protein